MSIDIEDVKRITLKPDDILWVKMGEDADMHQMTSVRSVLEKGLAESGKYNKIIVTCGDVEFQVITAQEAELVSAHCSGPQCDCGGAATGGGHADYCSTRKIT